MAFVPRNHRRPAALAPLMFGAFTLSAQAIASPGDVPTSRIYGGEPVETCEWPTTVGLRICTGTLIHPRVVLYAAHCGKKIPTAQFGEAYGEKIAKKVKISHCKTNPKFKGNNSLGAGVDSAYCVLEEAVEDVPIAPVFYGCETEELKENGTIWLAGFGKNNNTEGLKKSGIKFKVETEFVKLKAGGKELEVGPNGKTACNGDSGGPAFMKMSDGTWRTIGITSYGVDTSCTKHAFYTNASTALVWIQESLNKDGYSDIDLTPCYDEDGTWNPSEKCGGFATDPGTAYGSWDNFCSEGAPKSGASSICGKANPKAGDADSPGGDKTPPEVEITGPSDKDTFKEGKMVVVKAKASDDEDENPKVTLLVDGKEQKEVEKAPYKWELKDLKVGTHKLEAKATDEAGNEATSEAVTIEVTEDGGKKDPSPGGSAKSEEPGEDKDSQAPKGSDEGSSGGEEPEDTEGESAEPNGSNDPEGSAGQNSGNASKDSGCNTAQGSTQPWGWLSILALLGLGRRRRNG